MIGCAQCVLEYATKIGQGNWASRQSITYICRYLSTAAKQSGTQAHLKPYLLDVLTHVAVPLTFFSADLHQEWKEDPTEVIRRNSSALMMAVVDDLYDPRDAAISLIRDVMRTKALREALLDPFMKSILSIAAECTQSGMASVCLSVAMCKTPTHPPDYCDLLDTDSLSFSQPLNTDYTTVKITLLQTFGSMLCNLCVQNKGHLMQTQPLPTKWTEPCWY